MTIVRVIDFEATGLHPTAQVCEVGLVDFDIETRTIVRTSGWLCSVSEMPPDTRAVHHIRLEETQGLPPHDRWLMYEEAMRAGAAAFVAHNIELESRYICGSLPLLCTYKAALRTWPDAPKHSVFALLYWLEDAGKVTYDRALAHPPHRALPDAYATAILLGALLEQGVTGKDLTIWTAEPAMLPRCPIGSWRNHPWPEVETSFLNWILSKPDMDPDIRFCARAELDRRYPLPPLK